MKYVTSGPMTASQVLEKASEIIDEKYCRGAKFSCPEETKSYLRHKLGLAEREIFAVIYLDNQNQIIQYEEVFFGTLYAASIYPREVVKQALAHNAGAVILAHNHPSGLSAPSESDKRITKRLIDALKLVDVRVLDHIIVGDTCYSFAEEGEL